MKERPTGIIRTLPYNPESRHGNLRAAFKEMMRCLRALNTDDDAHFFIGMAQKPVHEVLHIYIIASGRVVGRANIVTFLSEQPPMMRLDQTVHQHKYWCVLSAPFEEPPEKMKMRGHRGFHYVYEPLW